MTEKGQISRRAVLRFSALCSVSISSIVAGCPAPGETVLDQGPEGQQPEPEQVETDGNPSSQPTSTSTVDDRPLTAAPKYGDWFSNVENYDQKTVVYMQDETSVTVRVGAEGNGGYHSFRYPAIAVPQGATVTWAWTGNGGAHNVVAADDQFSSGEPVESDKKSFDVSFEKTGTYRYYCETHRASGMKGAVTVY